MLFKMSTSKTNRSCVKISRKQFGEFCRTCLTKISPPANPVFIYGTIIDDTPLTELLCKCVNIKALQEDKLPSNMCTRCVFNLGKFHSFYRQCQKSQQTLQSVLNLENIIKKNTTPLKFHTYSKPVDESVTNNVSPKLISKPVLVTKRTLQKVKNPELAPIQFIHSYCKPPPDEENVTNPPPSLMVKQEPGMDDTLPPAPTEQILLKTENLHTNSDAPPLVILTPEMKKTVFQKKKQMLSEESVKLENPSKIKILAPEMEKTVFQNKKQTLSEESVKLENPSKINTATDIFSEEIFENLVKLDDLYADNMLEHQQDRVIEPIVNAPKKTTPQTPRRVQESSDNKPKVVRKRKSRLTYTPLEAIDSNNLTEKNKDSAPDNTTDPTPDNAPPDVEPKPPTKRQYKCADCDLVFKGYHMYKTHTYSHKGGQMPHVCKHCGKDFLLNSLLKKHYYSHTNEKTILCTFCSKFFKTPALLRLHIKKVHFNKPEDDLIDDKCPKCDKHFTSKKKYRMHQKVHSTRRHLCSECGKIYKTKTLFIQHMRLHTGEAPYKCTFCDKGFRNNFGLKHHVYSHTGEKPYECDVCQKKFRRPSHLRTHKKTHANEGRIKCSFCEKSFLTVASWEKHASIHNFQEEENSDFETDC